MHLKGLEKLLVTARALGSFSRPPILGLENHLLFGANLVERKAHWKMLTAVCKPSQLQTPNENARTSNTVSVY